MKVPYHKVSPLPDYAKIFSGKPIYLPLLTIVVRHQNRKRKLLALVDSGADACLFPRDVAEILGIDVTAGRRADLTGIGGNRIPFFFHEIEILFGRFQVRTQAGFAKGSIGTTGLLGQKGFFDQFAISFHCQDGFFEIRKPNLLDRLKSKLPP